MSQFEGTQIADDGLRYPIEDLPLAVEAVATVQGPGPDSVPEPSPNQSTPSGELIDEVLELFAEEDE